MVIQNIKVTVDALVFRHTDQQLQVLLVKRKFPPGQGMWAIPGGFVEDDEELEAAAIRELQEETGLTLPGMTQLHTFAKVGRDSRGRSLTVVHYAFTEANNDHIAGADDAEEAQWINLKDIQELAFDHMEILEFALQELGNRMSYLIS